MKPPVKHKDMEITKGEWERTFVGEVENPKYLSVVSELPGGGRQHICSVDYSKEYNPDFVRSLEANFDLIAEAGTVKNETGFSPRQLAEQKAELVYELQHTLEMLNTPPSERMKNIELARINNIEECLKKVQ